jgi:hypothetical protein
MKISLLAAFFAAFLAQMAFASTITDLEIVSGATTITIADNGVGDLNPATGAINYTNPDVNGWTVEFTFGLSDSPGTSTGLDLASLTASCGGVFTATCSADPLHILFSATGFTQADFVYSTTYSSTQSGIGTTSESAYLDAGNGIFAETTLIGTVGPFIAPGGVGTVTNALISAGPSPYSLTLDQVFTDLGTGSDVVFSADGVVSGGTPGLGGNVAGSVPEPGTAVLFGTMLALCTLKLRRRLVS